MKVHFKDLMSNGYCSGTMMFVDLHEDKGDGRVYWERAMFVNTNRFETYLMHIWDVFKETKEISLCLIGQLRLESIQRTKYLQYLEGERTLQTVQDVDWKVWTWILYNCHLTEFFNFEPIGHNVRWNDVEHLAKNEISYPVVFYSLCTRPAI